MSAKAFPGGDDDVFLEEIQRERGESGEAEVCQLAFIVGSRRIREAEAADTDGNR